MVGLIIKDFLTLRKQLNLLLVLIVLYGAFSFQAGSGAFLSGMVVMLGIFLNFTSFAYDDQAKFNVYAATLPLSEKEIVGSKYVVGLIMLVISTLLSVGLNVLVASIEKSVHQTFFEMYILVGGALLFLAALLPVLYKFGVERSRIILFMLVLVPAGATAVLSYFNVQIPDLNSIVVWLNGLPIIGIAAYAGSYFLSCYIYKHKEF